MKQNWQRFLLFGVIVVLVAGTAVLRPMAAAPQLTSDDRAALEKLNRHFVEAIEVVRENYLEEVDYEVLTKVGIEGMLHTLDPHSNFWDKKAFTEMTNTQNSRYFGIGAMIASRDGKVFISEPFRDTPSARAGLRYGDHIIGIDGENTEKWNSTTQVSNRLKGEQGTKVTITVQRLGVAEPIKLTLERDAIPQPSINNAFLVRPGIGYVSMARGFHSTTNDELTQAMATLKEQGASSVILDLRDNRGGYLHIALSIMEKFLQRSQTIVSVRYRDGSIMNRDLQTEMGSQGTVPLVVLINGDSASASEIVAGAIQDHDRGLIVGENSFGKGLVQNIFPLSSGAGLTLTTARYFTPSGRLIQRDYSSNSMYEYLTKRSAGNPTEDAKQKNNKTWMTDLRRPVYGGGGINPDVKVKDTRIRSGDPLAVEKINSTQGFLLTPIFLFVRELIAGQVESAKDFKLNGPPQFDHQLKPNEYVVNDGLMKLFRETLASYLKKNPEVKLAPAALEEQMAWVRQRIRYEVLTAAYGGDKALQAMSDTDAQLQRAVAELPNAAALAERAKRSRSVSAK